MTHFLKEMMSLPSTKVEYNQICFISNNQKDTEASQALQGHVSNGELSALLWKTHRLKMPLGIEQS